MKITKRQLRRIIKEEKTRLLNETDAEDKLRARMQGMTRSVGNYPRDATDWVETLGQLIDQDLTSRGVWYEEEGYEIVAALEKLRRKIKDNLRGPIR